MYRKTLIISFSLGLFLYSCGGNNQDTEVSPDNISIQNTANSKHPWWKFWAKKSTNACPCKQAQANAEIKDS